MKWTSFLLVFLCFALCEAKDSEVLIFTYSYNRPDFIEIQNKTLKKFLKDDYRFVVFNDAVDPIMHNRIAETCRELDIECISIPQEIHSQPYLDRNGSSDYNSPSVRNCNVVQYSLDLMGFDHQGIVALFDSDLFLVKPFSIKKYMKGEAIGGHYQSREKNDKKIDYLWIGIVFLDFNKMPDHKTINFNTGPVRGVMTDSGGFTHYYLRAHRDIPVKYFQSSNWPYSQCKKCRKGDVKPCQHNAKQLLSQGFTKKQIPYIYSGHINYDFFEDQTFLHYRAGSNWDGKTSGFHMEKTKILNEWIENALQK